jgi:hypothetical protein
MPMAKTIALATLAIVVAAPAATTLFLSWKRVELAKRVKVETKVDTPIPSSEEIKSIPHYLRVSPSKWVLSIEQASKAIPICQLPALKEDFGDEPSLTLNDLLARYLRANMLTFTYTPQAPLLKWMCKAAEAKRTFDKDYLENLGFAVGDLVCGVFRVVVFEHGRIEMALDPHESFKGPRTEGMIVAKVEERSGSVVFFNGESC